MTRFKIVPLSEAYAAKIRAAATDDFGNAVIEKMATGYGPCRVSLTPFVPGQDIRLIFGHSPFTISNAFNQPGPVFIHKKEVAAYSDVHRFPPLIKADKKNFPLTLIGYSTGQKMMLAQLVGGRDVDEMIVELFDNHPEVAYLHARNAEACCYICAIERAG